ncbi:hypothetical protein BASA81_000518 [Batrachochytrium salamandrivorans]|nr:hypothetical protein BASA81_000518 [Batrachochytrium salamandrivorans]
MVFDLTIRTLLAVVAVTMGVGNEWGANAAVDCAGGIDQFCPATSAPVVDFSLATGSVNGSTIGCCKGSFLQCQVQDQVQFRRTIAQYVIPGDENNGLEPAAVEICPIPDSPDCNCQQILRSEVALELNFCLSSPSCCPECECHGDPHCTSFQRDLDTFAVCDNRDDTCTRRNETCGLISWDNVPCVWEANKCMRSPNTTVPAMDMYSKTYRSYFDPEDDAQYEFKLTLQLGLYGAIGDILITDAGTNLTFSVGTKSCDSPSRYPIRNHKVRIDNLPSGVQVELTCVLPHTVNRRWDVTKVVDPWFVQDHSNLESFGGFCALGVIPEASAAANLDDCRVLDRQLAAFYSCPFTTPIDQCKRNFCEAHFRSFHWTFRPRKSCYQFVIGTTNANNFLIAACTFSLLPSRNPLLCLQDVACRKCVDDILDFPDEMPLILSKSPLPAAIPRANDDPVLFSTSCQADLLSLGLARAVLQPSFSGIEIQFRNLTSTAEEDWLPIFALFDSEITLCGGGCTGPLLANGTEALALTQPGQYRILQGVGLDMDASQNVCESAAGINASVTYSNPTIDGEAVGTPLGLLWNEALVVCNPSTFPNCPDSYQCCVWPRPSEDAAWVNCMAQYGGPELFPSC